MDTDSKSGKTEANTMVSGSEIKQMDRAHLFMLMAIFTKGSGRMTKLMATEHISTPTEQPTSENGLKTNSTEPESKNGQMVPNMKASTKTEGNMEMDVSLLQMEARILGNSATTKSPASANTSGPTKNNTKENGRKIKCMEKAFLFGEMGRSMKDRF